MTMVLQDAIEWVGTPPRDWRSYRVKALFHDDAENITVDQLSELRVDHYSIPSFDEFGAPVNEDGVTIASNKTLLSGGELLFSKLNTHKPRVWLVPEDDQVKVASTEFIVLREWHRGALDKSFFRYLLSSVALAKYISCFQTSVTNSHKRISPEDLWRTRVPFPPVAEQHRIAHYLDVACAAIDATVVAKRRQLATLDALRLAIVTKTVTRGLNSDRKTRQTGNVWMNQLPEPWQLVSLKRICEIQTGLTLGKTYDGPLIERPYLRVANVQDGHLDLTEITTIDVPTRVAKSVELRRDDVLMTEGGDLDKLGRGYLWNDQISGCLHQNHIFAVRCTRHKLVPKFLTYLTASSYGRDYFEATGKRTTNLASTNSTKVGAFPIPLPSIKEQMELVEYLDERIEQLRATQEGIEVQIETLIAYRKSLIHECVTGQQRVEAIEPELDRVKAYA
jgi:type I restriction enzyme S subunit